MGIRQFSIFYLLLVVASAFIFWSLDQFVFSNQLLIPYFWLTFGYMAAITLLVYGVSLIGIKKGGEYQSAILLSAIVLRLLLTLVFLLVYALKVKVSPLLFSVNFFSIYLLFTAFEIYCLLRNLRHQIRK